MKRVLAAILSLVIVMSFAACGDSSGGEIKDASSVTTGNSGAEAQPSEQAGKTEPEEVTIPETVLLEESGVKITAKASKWTESLDRRLNSLLRTIPVKT
ncbi:hypothetical protein [Pseudoflavonifractor hominis]|uniref:ABC transporter substrate-binding protein n=1 Tax=Pseudoflavonifractor hominis TaxID=2763059 RepID=A0ABR7HPY2_9FIRM|nr:hypothetical protein [Pseudoflavonifractor hominis]MBC5729497.1 hypothetical protein [Pseudoflavonifractor hominis]